jgi:hypothetical protein
MSNTIIRVENVSKAYRLGQIGSGTLRDDMKVWWAKARGKPNPLLKIGQEDHGNREGDFIWALHNINFSVEEALFWESSVGMEPVKAPFLKSSRASRLQLMVISR